MNSPAITEYFPPPLIMFSRTTSNRRSTSRTNPLFIRKITTANDANQEPSSPKVTCIGQVRSNRSNNKQTPTAVRRSKWVRRLKLRWLRRVWVDQILIFRCNCCRKLDSNRSKSEMGGVIGGCDGGLVSESPVRDVVVLTRSRSAPISYSSAGNKIWESNDEMGEKVGEKMVVEEEEEDEDDEDEGSINGVEGAKAEDVSLSRCKSEPVGTGEKLVLSLSS